MLQYYNYIIIVHNAQIKNFYTLTLKNVYNKLEKNTSRVNQQRLKKHQNLMRNTKLPRTLKTNFIKFQSKFPI